MAQPAFTTWLPTQRYRDDPVGGAALLYLGDVEFAPRAVTAEEVRQRMLEIDAEPYFLEGLRQAADEYQTLTPYAVLQAVLEFEEPLPDEDE